MTSSGVVRPREPRTPTLTHHEVETLTAGLDLLERAQLHPESTGLLAGLREKLADPPPDVWHRRAQALRMLVAQAHAEEVEAEDLWRRVQFVWDAVGEREDGLLVMRALALGPDNRDGLERLFEQLAKESSGDA